MLLITSTNVAEYNKSQKFNTKELLILLGLIRFLVQCTLGTGVTQSVTPQQVMNEQKSC